MRPAAGLELRRGAAPGGRRGAARPRARRSGDGARLPAGRRSPPAGPDRRRRSCCAARSGCGPIAGAAHEPAVLAAIRAAAAPACWSGRRKRRPPRAGRSSPDTAPPGSISAREPRCVRQGLAADWRRATPAGRAGGLTVRQLASRQAIGWLLERNEAHRRKVGYRGPSRQFLGHWPWRRHEARELVLLLAFERAEPVAGIMVMRHGGRHLRGRLAGCGKSGWLGRLRRNSLRLVEAVWGWRCGAWIDGRKVCSAT